MPAPSKPEPNMSDERRPYRVTCRLTSGEVIWTADMTGDEYERWFAQREKALATKVGCARR
jgi:hypothetical protein